MFAASKLMILNKVDLLPYLNFDVEKCIAYAKQVNQQFRLSSYLLKVEKDYSNGWTG